MTPQSQVLQRQAPLRTLYKEHPEKAVILKRVRTLFDRATVWSYGIDRAVGGLHDVPNPGELLCAALAACQEATLRMVADLLGIKLQSVEVEVVGKVDVRGSMAVDRAARVGFESMQCEVRLHPAPGTPPELYQQLIAKAERSCINLQTLRAGVPVEVSFKAD